MTKLEKALKHLAEKEPTRFCLFNEPDTFGLGGLHGEIRKWKYSRSTKPEMRTYDMSIESMQEIAEKMDYIIWAEPSFRDETWYGRSSKFHMSLHYTEYPDNASFREAIESSLIGVIYDVYEEPKGGDLLAQD